MMQERDNDTENDSITKPTLWTFFLNFQKFPQFIFFLTKKIASELFPNQKFVSFVIKLILTSFVLHLPTFSSQTR